MVLNISMSLQSNTYSEAITDSIVSVKLHGDVCLICPYVFDASAGLSWRRGVNQSYLFRGEARTYDNIQLNLSINKCESKHYAMGVIDVRDGVNDGTYTCSKRSQRIASFQVHVQGKLSSFQRLFRKDRYEHEHILDSRGINFN